MQYVPLWLDIIDGPCWKLLDLTPEVFRFYTLCLLAAQKFDFVEGFLPDDRTLAAWIHMDRDEVVTLRDMAVTSHVLERTDDGQYKIHDWEHWRDSKDPTAAIRKRKERAKKKALASNVTGESRNGHADVTGMSSDVTPQNSTNSIQQTTNNTHTQSECVCEKDPAEEPFQAPCTSTPEPMIVIPWTPEEKRIIDRATQRWGASNGDRGVGDLLKDFPAGLVAEACDKHYAAVQGAFNLPRLRGLCRALWNDGKWRPSVSSRSSGGPTNQPAEVPAESMSKYQAEADEAAAKYGRSPAEYREKVKRGELPKPKV